MEKFRPHVEGREVTIITDHSSLRWLHTLKNPTGRLARWAMKLLAHDIKIEHRKGTEHRVPDALSRMFEDSVFALIEETDTWYQNRVNQVNATPSKYYDWRVKDGKLYYRSPNFKNDLTQDGSEWKYVVPENSRKRILFEAHDSALSAHQGIEKTYHRVRQDYFWPRMYSDVLEYVKSCLTCQKVKVEQRQPAGLLGGRVLEHPWAVVATDIMEFPRSKNGFNYLIVFQDLFTKYIELVPLRSANGNTVKKAFIELIMTRWGVPRVLLTDNGTEFVNKVTEDLAEEFGFHHSTIPPYYAQANPVERVNRVLKSMIISFLGQDHRDWDLYVYEFRFAYNTASHSSSKLSPTFLNFGRDPLLPNSWKLELERDLPIEKQSETDWESRMGRVQAIRDWVVDNLEKAHKYQEKYFNAKHREVTFKLGDLVMQRHRVLSNKEKNIAAKLVPKFRGPLEIIKVLSPLVYILRGPKGEEIKAIVSDLKTFNKRENYDNNI